MTSPETDTTKSEGKRKKESTPSVMISAFEFSDPRIIGLIQSHPQAYTVYTYVRCLSRVEATLKLPFDQAIATLSWCLHIERNEVEQILNSCVLLSLLEEDNGEIFCPKVVEDVTKYDEKRRILSEAGKRGGNKAQAKLKGGSSHPQPSQVRKGKVRIGKESKEEVDPNYPTPLLDWIEYRKATKKPLTISSIKAILKSYDGRPEDLARDVQHSMSQGYQGLFAPSTSGKPAKAPPDQSGFDLIKRLADEERRALGISD